MRVLHSEYKTAVIWDRLHTQSSLPNNFRLKSGTGIRAYIILALTGSAQYAYV